MSTWQEDERALAEAAEAVRRLRAELAAVRAENAELRAIAKRQMTLITRLAAPAGRQRREDHHHA